MLPPQQNARRILARLAAALGLLSAFGLAVFLHTRIDRELSELPEPARRALYERTRETLGSSCTHARGPEVTAYCQQQADFIKRFPECDRACRDLAARSSPQPSR